MMGGIQQQQQKGKNYIGNCLVTQQNEKKYVKKRCVLYRHTECENKKQSRR